jgi:hypothetical protein
VEYFLIIFRKLPADTKEITQNLDKVSSWFGQVPNKAPAEHLSWSFAKTYKNIRNREFIKADYWEDQDVDG